MHIKTTFFFLAALCLFSAAGETPISRRTAWLKDLASPQKKEKTILKGLDSSDKEIRARAVYEFYLLKKEAALPELEKRISRAGLEETMNLIICARMVKDQAKKTAFLSAIAAKSPHAAAVREANRCNFPFSGSTIRLSERKDWDFEIVKVKTISLQDADWKFLPDRQNAGHLSGYYKTDFPDQQWKRGETGYWKGSMTAWYRIRFQAPPKPDCNAAELNFSGVEEAAWVWVNGVYIGCRDKGPAAWNQPFQLDITQAIQWGKENVLAVRVLNTGHEGGIYKPIALDILK
ncbi:MAG: beta galactosidase jelly roll domain-containing protein [Lentisphaeria bacterium]|nr:beta galactosidase jelly roll domain-containing protein [Lentisphaeria bacterium]